MYYAWRLINKHYNLQLENTSQECAVLSKKYKKRGGWV